jgi:hypothetical protein
MLWLVLSLLFNAASAISGRNNGFSWVSPITLTSNKLGFSLDRHHHPLDSKFLNLKHATHFAPKLRGHTSFLVATATVDSTAATPSGRSVGIDLGTTNSAVAAVRDGQPFIIPNSLGNPTTPSVVAYRKDESGNLTIVVGTEAEQQADANPACTFASVKRVIGRKRADIVNADVSPGLRGALEQADAGETRLRCPAAGRSLSPEEVSAQVPSHATASMPAGIAAAADAFRRCARARKAVEKFRMRYLPATPAALAETIPSDQPHCRRHRRRCPAAASG